MLRSLLLTLLVPNLLDAFPSEQTLGVRPLSAHQFPVQRDLNYSAPAVTVKNGTYIGTYSQEYDQDFFLGVPFAQPPVEDLRFRVPQSLNSTFDFRSAAQYAPACVGYGSDQLLYSVSEDCLYLNIIRPSGAVRSAPKNTTKLPVAVWIYGGGLYEGATSDVEFNLSQIVQNSVDIDQPLIGISIAYRLAAWGFISGKEALAEGVTNIGMQHLND
jgi:carboxylesterase type B